MEYIYIAIAFIVLMFIINLVRSTPPKRKAVPPLHYTGKLSVDLEECKVVSSQEAVEPFQPNISSPFASAADPAVFDQDTKKTVFSTYIVFEKNGRRFISDAVDKDKTTVSYYLITKKTTTIYYDPNNPGNYFFDLSFLED